MGSSLATAPRQVLLAELHGRLEARFAAIQKRLHLLKEEFEKLSLERLELRAELRVLERETQKCTTMIRKANCFGRRPESRNLSTQP
jgi:hypothetical protein